jgi:hypothetical protein
MELVITPMDATQWTLMVDRQPCTSDGQCDPGEFCEGGVCQPHVM